MSACQKSEKKKDFLGADCYPSTLEAEVGRKHSLGYLAIDRLKKKKKKPWGDKARGKDCFLLAYQEVMSVWFMCLRKVYLKTSRLRKVVHPTRLQRKIAEEGAKYGQLKTSSF